VAVGGGSESMSRGPYFDTAARYGARMGDAKSIDYMLGILHDPWQKMHMGITAENVAERYKIARDAGPARAAKASAAPPPPSPPVTSRNRSSRSKSPRARAPCCSRTDEHVRAATTLDVLAGMKPAFKKDGGTCWICVVPS
jgi:acetyl-CoA C-acetyltransferase